MRLARFAAGMPAAATVTFFLFLGMMTLITVEYREEAPIPDYEIDIFPTVEPIPDPEIRTDLPVTQFDPPPPPIRLEVARAAVDAAPEAMDIGALPTIETPAIEHQGIYVAANREETPLVRFDPVYPDNLLMRGVEGNCLVVYDIAADGTPFNISANCSNSGFVRSAERAVQRWRFNPRREDGQDVVRRARQTNLDFRIAD
ncbi:MULTISPECIES: energy transducer TonB [Hyphobacterium]|uniref:TonB family protein n=1 Tax=Hyphobacterium vulgare TaxID=1736751 RepID=A0ABV6ZUY1_9PROT